MCDGRRKRLWDHTAALMSLLYNVFRGPKSPPKRIEDFHPYMQQQRRRALPKVGVDFLQRVLVKDK